MDGILNANRHSSDYDLYAALMLSNLLDNEQDIKDQQMQKEAQQAIEKAMVEVKVEEELTSDGNNVIWVPADKHPQIAPTEFANFIKTHGANIPTKSTSNIKRRKSILSQSLYVKSSNAEQDEQDELDLNRTLSEKKRNFLKKVMTDSAKIKDTHVFDRNSTSFDDSLIISPKTDKSLLRRSAFSAREKSRKGINSSQDRYHRRSLSQKLPSNENKPWDKSIGIDLFDQPVNMSEWIDLGSASLESDNSQRGILSRVHDAESQLLTTTTTTTNTTNTTLNNTNETTIKNTNINASSAENIPKPNVKEEKKKTPPPKRPVIVRSPSQTVAVTTTKPEKRSSWLGGLFQDNKKKATSSTTVKSGTTTTTTATITATATATNTATNTTTLSGLATLFSRSLSLKQSPPITTRTNPLIRPSLKSPALPSPSLPPPQIQDKKPSRLEQCSRFNSNRLPLHVERAIYRLSHMKLADPKRPLQQQVLISNLMFWYLSIQQNDFQQEEQQQRLEMNIPLPITQQNKKLQSKMTRLIHSAKKRKNEVSQFVQLTSNESNNLKKSNVQFNLAPIPSHHHPVLNFEEEDDVPLSHYKK